MAKFQYPWHEVELTKRESAQHVPGVYVLYQGDAVVYVGASINIGDRIRKHRRAFCFDRAKASLVKKPQDRKMRERRLIYRLRPRFNRQIPSCAGVSVAMYAMQRYQ